MLEYVSLLENPLSPIYIIVFQLTFNTLKLKKFPILDFSLNSKDQIY